MAFKWTDESRTFAIEEYRNRMSLHSEEDQPKFTQEVVDEISKELGCTGNSARSIIQKAKNPDGSSVYISKAASKQAVGKVAGEGSKRKSKTESHADLVAAISSYAGESYVDMSIIDKLTGKSADYFTAILLNGEGE